MGKPLKIFVIIIALTFIAYDTIIKSNYYIAIEIVTYVVLFNLISDVLIISRKDDEMHRIIDQRNILQKILLKRARMSSKSFSDDSFKSNSSQKKKGK